MPTKTPLLLLTFLVFIILLLTIVRAQNLHEIVDNVGSRNILQTPQSERANDYTSLIRALVRGSGTGMERSYKKRELDKNLEKIVSKAISNSELFFRSRTFKILTKFLSSLRDNSKIAPKRNRRLRETIEEYGRVVKRGVSRKNNENNDIDEYYVQEVKRCSQDRILISFLLIAIPFDLDENCLNKRSQKKVIKKDICDTLQPCHKKPMDMDQEERKNFAEIYNNIQRYRRIDPNLRVSYKKNRKTGRPGSWRIM